MPCWYYDKKDLLNTPSFRDGISPETEARYRRDGARFIIDAGAKMGLRYDTCATGVVYFHRFYMFHSFSEFPRCVTAACCLFLAGKVEETPKKCKDLIKITKSMLSETQFATFNDDPKEEIMTMERILLQTIKFDLMVEHPYAYLLKFAKLIKGDKAKVQKLVQMSWTFINDSLCTTLSLQWEPEVTAVALMYLASRLNKFEINDWQNKPVGFKGKWYEFFVEDIALDLLEDICHQVLDLYSKPPHKRAESPVRQPSNAGDVQTPKAASMISNARKHGCPDLKSNASLVVSSAKQQIQAVHAAVNQSQVLQNSSVHPPSAHNQQFSQTNPYVATGMYSSSFMDQEGSQSIQSLVHNQEVQHAKVVGHPQSFQYNYQQPLPGGTPALIQLPQAVGSMQGFHQNPGNDGDVAFQGIQRKAIYQEASPGNTFNISQSNIHQWR